MIKIEFNPDEAQLRQFGFIALFGFALMGLMVLWQFTGWQMNWATYLLFGLAIVCPLLAMVAPKALKPVFVLMMLIALPIGFVISAVLLRLVYYGMFTPIALFFKMRGRDAMQRTLDPQAETYWQDHRDKARPRAASSYLRLY